MNDPSAEMQKAIHAKLVGSSAVQSAMGGTARVFDKVQKDTAYPYIRIGDDQAVGRSNACSDGWDFYSTIHVFSRDALAPRMETKRIMDAVLQALGDDDALPTPTGFRILTVELQTSRTYFEADGVTNHGILTLDYLVRPS